MKKTLFFLFIVSSLVTSNVKADTGWTMVTESEIDDKFYLDYKRIRKDSSNKFFWYLIDYGKEDKFGDSSAVSYTKVDCGAFRYKRLDTKFYASGMGKGKLNAHIKNETEWLYPKRESSIEEVLNKVCDY
jgi:hypothetical protein